MSPRSMILLIVTAVAIVAAMCVGALFLVRSSRAPQTHLVPHGYKGWVSVTYGVEGWGVDDYFYDDGSTRKLLRQRPVGMEGETWGSYTRTALVIRVNDKVTRSGVSTGFFVGTEEEWQANPRLEGHRPQRHGGEQGNPDRYTTRMAREGRHGPGCYRESPESATSTLSSGVNRS